MTPIFCKHCQRSITWEDQKYAFGNLTINNYDPLTLKSIFPSHLKCAKKWLKDNKIKKISKSKSVK